MTHLKLTLALVGFFAGIFNSQAANGPQPVIAPIVETAQAQHDRLSLSGKWGQEQKTEFVDFRKWADQYLAATTDAAREKLLARGIQLATTRQTAMLHLIETNPREALDRTVPAAILAKLPPQIVSLLEKRVEGNGDLMVSMTTPVPGQKGAVQVYRTVTLNGTTYQAHVYGRRLYQATKYRLPLSGIALGDQLALLQSPVRLLETDEKPPGGVNVIKLSATPGSTTTTPLLLKSGAQVYSAPDAQAADQLEAQLIQSESALGPNLTPISATPSTVQTNASTPSQVSQSTPTVWSLGPKQVLVIRVDFSDLPGIPVEASSGAQLTPSYIANIVTSQIAPFYASSSYGKTSITATVSSNVYRMPQTASSYAVNNNNAALQSDAQTLAAADFTLANYDRIIVVFSYLGNISGAKTTYAGLGDVGGTRIWINGYFELATVDHELGHTYGLEHANFWQVSDGNPVSATGTSIEYGDGFDTMGSGGENNNSTAACQFNPWDKYMLQWLTDANVQVISANGTYRVNRFDGASSTGIEALKIVRDSNTNYWIGLRKITGESLMSNSAYVIWGYNTLQTSNLIDTQLPINSAGTSGLAVGNIFSDTTTQMVLQTLDEGGASGSEYLDIAVNFSSYGVNLSTFPPTGGTCSGAAAYHVGSAGTISAAPASGFVFSNWTENGTVVSTSPTYTFTVNAPHRFVANFYPTTATSWVFTGSSNYTRDSHTSTLLGNGKVLTVGGSTTGPYLTRSSEYYDPTLHSWTTTGQLNWYLGNHTASLLSTGSVLAAGGYSGNFENRTQLYNPSTGVWTAGASMAAVRGNHTATVLGNGQVLVAGGTNSTVNSITACELYNSTSGTWTATGNLAHARSYHTATLLANGKVLALGGEDASYNLMNTAELYDPVAKTWSSAGTSAFYRVGHTATLLNNGKVLVAGGASSNSNVELYNPATNTWSTAASLNVGRANHTATLLSDGTVLVAGGQDSTGKSITSVELYNPTTNTWTVQPSMNAARSYHTANLLGDGSLLVSGGADVTNAPIDSAELFYRLTLQTVTGLPSTLSLNSSASPYTLPSTTTSGLTLTYTVLSGPATVSGNTLTLTGPGTVVVQATQSGNNTYAGFTQNETITVTGGTIATDTPTLPPVGIILLGGLLFYAGATHRHGKPRESRGQGL